MKGVFQRRLKRIQKVLTRRQAGLLILCPENRRYLSGFPAQDVSIIERSGALLITPKEAFLLTDPRYQEEAKECAPSFEPVIYRHGLLHELSRVVPKLGLKKLLFEELYISYAGFKALERRLPQIELEGLKGLVERLRAIKDESEIALIRQALRIAEEILTKVSGMLSPGVTEKEIAAKIIELSHRLAEGPSFPPIVASGPMSARPHAEPSSRKLQTGEPVIIDMGVKYQGYCSDITRTFCVGRPSSRFKEIYQLVLQAKEAAQKEIRAGIYAKVPDSIARGIFKQAGVEKYFWHSLGHGVGLNIHEAPSLSFRSREKLRAGHVVTVEPGLYFPDWGGIRLEDMVVIREWGSERLNQMGFLQF